MEHSLYRLQEEAMWLRGMAECLLEDLTYVEKTLCSRS